MQQAPTTNKINYRCRIIYVCILLLLHPKRLDDIIIIIVVKLVKMFHKLK